MLGFNDASLQMKSESSFKATPSRISYTIFQKLYIEKIANTQKCIKRPVRPFVSLSSIQAEGEQTIILSYPILSYPCSVITQGSEMVKLSKPALP